MLAGAGLRLVEPLGQGGMGTVWRAEQPDLKRVVAVKLLRLDASGAARDEALRRLRDEARAAAKLRHPALVSVLASGDDPDLGPWVAYEYVPGGTLRSELSSRGALPWPEALERVARPLLEGLEALHRVGVIHRDVKPDNLFRGHDGRYKVGDLGLAQYEGRGFRTKTGIFHGSPGYVAPERIRGERSAGPAADVYAAAALLVEVLCGRLPFVGATSMAMVCDQADRDVTPDELARLGVPRKLAGVLAGALARDPARRPPGARELLRALVAPPPEAAPSPPAVDASLVASHVEAVLAPRPRRRRPALALATVAAAALVLWAGRRAPEAPASASAAATPRATPRAAPTARPLPSPATPRAAPPPRSPADRELTALAVAGTARSLEEFLGLVPRLEERAGSTAERVALLTRAADLLPYAWDPARARLRRALDWLDRAEGLADDAAARALARCLRSEVLDKTPAGEGLPMDLPGAVRAAEEALALATTPQLRARAALALAFAAARGGRLDRALELFRSVRCEELPDERQWWYERVHAQLLEGQERWSEAEAALERAKRLAPPEKRPYVANVDMGTVARRLGASALLGGPRTRP